MAGELQAHFATGAALYAVLLNENAQPWNGTTFDATPTTAEWASYVVALTEWSTTGLYRATMPAGIVTPGTYQVLVYKRLGGVGTEAPTDPVVWSGELAWSGSVVVGLEDVTGSSPTAIRDAVWGTTDGTRTVTQTGAQVADAIDGEDLTVHRGDTFSATLTGITIPTDWTKLVFTAKRGLSDADTASVVQIVLTNPSAGTDGLKYLEGAAPASPVVAADAALTVPGLTSLTITMKPHATKELGIGSGWFYDVQADYGAASNSTTVCAGAFAVDADVTRAVPS